MSISHLSVFVVVFFMMVAIVELIPELYQAYRKRYQRNADDTARELDRFFFRIKPTKIMIGGGITGVLIGAATGSWVIAVAIAVAGLFAPRILLAIWKDMRSTQFDAQLMDALILMSNSLRSGLDITAGFERVATTMKAPISEEFGLVLNAYRLGSPIDRALNDLLTRIKSRTLETVVYAISIQRDTGGNLIKTFEQLVITIREEAKLQKKVKAITSQARTQIIFMAAFPWFLGLFLLFMSRDFMEPALRNPWGQVVIVFLVIWELIGVVVTKKLVMVDV